MVELSCCQKCPQMPSAFRRPKLAKRLGFDLSNPLAGDVELLADFFEGVFPLAANSETEPDHLFFFR